MNMTYYCYGKMTLFILLLLSYVFYTISMCTVSLIYPERGLYLENKLLSLSLPHTGGSVTNCFSGVPLNTFMDATEAEIWNIIKLSPVKSCELHPLPTWLLKECKAELVPLITDIVNMSLLLKKTGLDSDILKNYRPVSNLTFISKVIEKVISGRLNEHFKNNSLFDPLRSATEINILQNSFD